MIVIARNNGPWYNDILGKDRKDLLEGNSYTVIERSYRNNRGHWVVKTGNFINPRESKFFIRVINENGFVNDYWNDYFLSTDEMRDIKLEELGVC